MQYAFGQLNFPAACSKKLPKQNQPFQGRNDE
jgi:hypothetical protein